MCKFKSGIVVPTAGGGFDLFHNPWTDSHEDLIRLNKLNDTARPGGKVRFARVEFSPESLATADDLDTYKLLIDEERKPEWFTKEMQAKTVGKMRLIVGGMIIKGDIDLLCGGVYILAKGAKVSTVKNAQIVVMLESSSVKEMRGSSSVKEMRGSSSVQEMWESSSVQEMWGSSSVKEMRGSSSVKEMWESSSVKEMRGSSSVQEMRGSSKIENDKREKKAE